MNFPPEYTKNLYHFPLEKIDKVQVCVLIPTWNKMYDILNVCLSYKRVTLKRWRKKLKTRQIRFM